jgi:hypothetical protein
MASSFLHGLRVARNRGQKRWAAPNMDCGTSLAQSAASHYYPPHEQFRVGPIFATLSCHDSHQLKARNRRSIANSGSRKHLIFPNSGILTKFQCGVTKGPTRNYLGGDSTRMVACRKVWPVMRRVSSQAPSSPAFEKGRTLLEPQFMTLVAARGAYGRNPSNRLARAES